ncbi:glycosyl hydrolase 115 family protein [Sphingomonas abaci]|uniref:Gylcosyl hydrolase 115 C-terminal domain-containing protein n=1 Tax=Sphingomonas abaci TaxID=237611 RepID=A0A7W7APJ2_9SPHN|nr:glycosyl hydrolase 115 family protein [Sphingomonas abaci]MBB4619797.1 hypothetical protein [Sphingomonas abaci]
MKRRYWLGAAWLGLASPALAQDCAAPVAACATPRPAALRLIAGSRPAVVVVDGAADPAVLNAARGLAGDLARVAGAPDAGVRTTLPASGNLVLVGELGRSPLIDRLVKAGRVSTASVAGRWEAYRQVVVDRPFPGILRALVILGADRRGAVFGAYDLSETIGVSPWAWWADVPVRRRTNLYITAGTRVDAPGVRYRGLFINDEEPAFGTWARMHFGGVNSKAYGHVFDLILRLKGNYLWPAMWGKSIAADDPASMALADARGLVLGTSHHEPMTRAQAEWHRDTDGGVTGGAWDYTTNAANLRAFWRGGIERMMSKSGRGYEQLVTVGMRGDGDEPMSRDTATGLLERIVADQRRIIADVTHRPAKQTPQLWALYKEVQDYYDAGLKVPDDVTLLFSDDNWGQIRRLPTRDRARAGGFGVYYHFDYVGGPRSYKWLANTQVEKTWQQMDLAWQSGARTIWIANVGGLKPMEYPIDFFLRMAWNPDGMTPAALAAYPRQWAARLFGPAQAEAIGALATDYARLAACRKPELVDADSFALGAAGPVLDGGAFGWVVSEWHSLADRTAAVRQRLAPDQQDAFAQLIGHPVAAMANLHDLYYAVAWNRKLAALGDARANLFADRAEAAFRQDKALTQAYHRLAGGKWDGMMLQTHFGYTSWNDPKVDAMPQVTRIAAMGGAVAPLRFATAAPRPGPAPGEDGTVDAADLGRSVAAKGLAWRVIPNLGRSRGALVALPQGRPATTPADGIRADYAMTLAQAGDATLRLTMIPTLDVRGEAGGRIGVSVDGGPVRTLTMNLVVDGSDWTRAVKDNGFSLEARLGPLTAGAHRVSLWRIDDNMPVQALRLYTAAPPDPRR